MIRRLVRMHFKEEFISRFRALFAERKARILNFPGCVSLELYQDGANASIWYTWSTWENEADLEAYRQYALFRETWQEVKQGFQKPAQAFTLRPENE